MHMNAKRPVLVPKEYWAEIEKLSKAALMDIVWDYAQRCASAQNHEAIMDELRAETDIILTHRASA
jgi:hypothetical protein